MRKISYPRQDPETREWRYNGKWYDQYPSEELEKDEAAYDDHWNREFRRKRDENDFFRQNS